LEPKFSANKSQATSTKTLRKKMKMTQMDRMKMMKTRSTRSLDWLMQPTLKNSSQMLKQLSITTFITRFGQNITKTFTFSKLSMIMIQKCRILSW
jgi:hypothetical protein